MIRSLDTLGPAFASNLYQAKRGEVEPNPKTACKPRHKKCSDTKNEIFLRERRLAAPQENA